MVRPSRKAATEAIAPRWPQWVALNGSLPITSAAFSEAVTIWEQCRPATLNAFDAEQKAIPRSAAASETVRNGTCRAPGRASGAWISSASTQAPWRAAASAIAASCSRLGTPPVGLWGLQRISATAPSAKRRSIVSGSSSPAVSGASASSHPSSSITAKKGW